MLYRIPGPLDLFGATPSPDGGTLALTASSPPRPSGTGERRKLNDADTEFIAKTAGRRMDGSPLPLPALLRQRERVLEQYKEAVGHFGAESQSTLFAKETLARLNELIAAEESPKGRAQSRLRDVLDRYDNGDVASDDEFRDAVSTVLQIEHDDQVNHPDAPSNGEAMALVVRATNSIYDKHKKAMRALIETARRPGSKVSDEELQKAAANFLGSARTRALLGADENDSDDDFNGTLNDLLSLGLERKTNQLNAIMQEAKKPGSRVSDEEISKAVREYLGAERQIQLVGGGDGSSSMAQVADAMSFVHERHKQELRSLVERSKQPGSGITKEQVQAAVVKVLGGERQNQLLGSGGLSDDDSKLLDDAVKLFGDSKDPEAPTAPPAPPKKSDNVMRMDTVYIIGHVPMD